MKQFPPKLISQEQDDFIQGRQIINGILLMHEVLHSIKAKNDEAMLTKLIMENVCDWVIFHNGLYFPSLGLMFFVATLSELLQSLLHYFPLVVF